MPVIPGAKIAISGAFSSGKTTLFNRLSPLFPDLHANAEIASAAKLAFPQLDWRRVDVRGYLRWAQIIAERSCDTTGVAGLFDGSYTDVLVHEQVFGVDIVPLTPEWEPSRYALTLLCNPADAPLEDNGIRETDARLRLDIQARLIVEAHARSARVVLLEGSVEDRVEEATREIAAVLEVCT